MSTTESKNQDDRIIQLEEQLAFQSKTIEELSSTLADQWTLVDAMKRKLDALAKRFLDLEETVGEAPANTKPPHY